MATNLYYLSVGLGLFFLAIGITKVVPVEPAYSTQVSNFNRYVSAFPFQSFTGYKPTANVYRAVFGVLEIALGVLLAFGNINWHRYSSLILMIMMVCGVYTLLAIGDPPQDLVVPVVVGALLLLLISRERHYHI